MGRFIQLNSSHKNLRTERAGRLLAEASTIVLKKSCMPEGTSMPKTRPFDVARHLDNPEVIRAYLAEMDAEIARLQADIDKLLSERQGWLDEIEQLRHALEATE